MVLASLPVILEFSPPVDAEKRLCDQWLQAARIVSQMQDSDSTVTALLSKLKQNLSNLEKDEVLDKLKQQIYKALEAAGIPREIRQTFAMVFVTLTTKSIQMVKAKRDG